MQISFAFCPSCHRDLRHQRRNSKEMEDLLRFYFQKGFSNKNILSLLSKYHDTKMCMRTLQQRLYDMGFKRRNVSCSILNVRKEIRNSLNGPGCLGGYRSHWHALRMKGIQVPHRDVEQVCREIDPAGCQERKAHRLR